MEPIKQEIINNIYENGENLITGPVLQEVLLDMVDDTNAKISSSVGDVVTLITEVSESALKPEDLEGYATEQWVEEQGYLKEVPEGYATTESLNQLSESVSASISSIPSVDLSGYATTQSVNEATESVKEWVEAKHYLTTASLSGSVTEETVQFMINDSTASMKEWVESQSYATETFVSESIASLDIPDTSGLVTTQSYNLDSADLSGYVTTSSFEDLEGRVDTLEGDLSDLISAKDALEDAGIIEWDGENEEFIAVPLATSESVGLISQSISQSIDIVAYKAEAGITSLSESVASDLGLLEERVAEVESGKVDWDTYDTERAEFSQSVAQDVADLSASIAAISGSIPDISGYATTESLNTVSQSLSASIAAITGSSADLSGYVTTASYNADSASFDQRINSMSGSEGNYLPLTGGALQDPESDWTKLEIHSPNDEGGYIELAAGNSPEDPDLPGDGLGTLHLEGISRSLNITSRGDFELTWYENEEEGSTYLEIPKIDREDVIAVRGDLAELSQSISQSISNITASGGGADTVLREYLFGTGSLLTDGAIYPSASSNWVWEVSESRTFPLGAEIGEGKSIQVIVHNVGASEVEISFNDEYWGPYSVVNGALGSGSFTVKAGEYGDVVATQIGDKIYFRTSVDLSNVEVDLSGYATTSSVQAISSSLGNYLPLAGGTLTGDLKVQSANVSFGNESNNNTIDNAHNGLVAGEGNYLGAHWDECAIGRQNRAEDDFAIALGCNNKVGKLAQGMGVKTTASAQLSTAIGHGVTANACGQVVIGSFNELDPSGSSSTTGSYAVILGNGLAENWSYNNPGNITRQNGLAIKWDGGIDINYSGSTITLQDKIAELEQDSSCLWLKGEVSYSVKLSPRSEVYGEYCVVEGDENNVTGQASHAEGWQNSASGQYSHVEGILNRASGQGAHAEGYNTTASGHQAHAEGRFTLASETATHAEGHRTTAVGYGTHAEGSNTRASQTSSHAEGYFTSASGWYSHAEGSGSKALGLASHAEGKDTIASADYSHAGGSGSVAQGSASYAGGWETVADYEYEHVIGRWNYQRAGLVSEEDKPLFAVGCGDDNIRKDAFEITRDGKHYIYGIGGYNGRNAQPGVNDVASVIANLVARIEALESGSNA